MSSGRRHLSSFVSVIFLLATGACVEARPQGQSSSTSLEAAKSQDTSGPKKPVRKPDQVVTEDSVALLAVRRAPAVDTATAPKPAESSHGNADGTAEDSEKKAAEISSLEKQIQEKTKRITLLIRLFVNDERPFLNDPANPKGDEVAQDRRKYEQDELLWETSELAKLKARLNQLTAAK